MTDRVKAPGCGTRRKSLKKIQVRTIEAHKGRARLIKNDRRVVLKTSGKGKVNDSRI